MKADVEVFVYRKRIGVLLSVMFFVAFLYSLRLAKYNWIPALVFFLASVGFAQASSYYYQKIVQKEEVLKERERGYESISQ